MTTPAIATNTSTTPPTSLAVRTPPGAPAEVAATPTESLAPATTLDPQAGLLRRTAHAGLTALSHNPLFKSETPAPHTEGPPVSAAQAFRQSLKHTGGFIAKEAMGVGATVAMVGLEAVVSPEAAALGGVKEVVSHAGQKVAATSLTELGAGVDHIGLMDTLRETGGLAIRALDEWITSDGGSHFSPA